MPSRTWVKIYCEKWLSGTLRQETPEFRGIWADLITLAGSGRYGDTGEIKLADNVPLTDQQIAGILNIPQDLWLLTKTRCLETDRLKCNGTGILQITNWAKYQSEYQRQKIYRGKLQPQVTPAGDSGQLHPQVIPPSDGEKEKEKEKEKEILSSTKTKDNLSSSLSNSKTEVISTTAEIYNIFEQDFQKITQTNSQQLGDLIDTYGTELVKEAIVEAVKQNKRSLAYVNGICKSCKEKGIKPGTPKVAGANQKYQYGGVKTERHPAPRELLEE